MNSITNEFEILDLSDHSGNSSNSDSSEITREFFQKEDLLKQSEINAPTTLGIYNYFMVPDIDYTNVTKLTLGCTSSIQCFDTFFKRMPKLEYFGYIYYTHNKTEENQCKLNSRAWHIEDNYSIKHFEFTFSQYSYEHIIRDRSDIIHFMSKLKCLQSFRTSTRIFDALVSQMIFREISFQSLYLYWDIRFKLGCKFAGHKNANHHG